MKIVYVNDQFVPAAQAVVSVFDRSYLFGEGLFETFRSFEGRLPLLPYHLDRLGWSATFLDLHLPENLDWMGVCRQLLEKNELKDARFKIVLSRLPEEADAMTSVPVPKGTQPNYKPQVTIFCEPLGVVNPHERFRLKVIKIIKNDQPPVVALKTTNWLSKLRGRYEALDAGYDDGILLNAKGLVTETCTGNIFWVDKDAKLWTVIAEQGLLGGVMKRALTDLFKEKQIKCGEAMLSPTELSSSREVFVTNSVLGIRPVVAIDSRQISGGEAGPITEMIMDLWRKKTTEMQA